MAGMGLRKQKLMRRRAALLERISVQREELAEVNARLQPVFLIADRAVLAGRFLFAHPVLVIGLTGLALVRRKGWVGLVTGAWRVWKTYRYVNNFSKKLTSRQ